ncbi:ATP-binding protein, putative [Actinidia rufa]|uniref:ATP-binding protein, putative n=1 Tax=Actinidia rufa TaxID=165716 RepID=A0A7J0FXG4_9ERIC|nr:ATP-binding protein, putative [Actinidia rufa]
MYSCAGLGVTATNNTATTMEEDDDDEEEEEGNKSLSSESDEEEEEEEELMLGSGKGNRERWIEHYASSHRILLVGEGDFSFSLSLAKAFASAHNMVATSLDTHQDIVSKYSNGIENVRELEEMGCLVLYGVDATKMSKHFFLRTQRLNKQLVKGFLMNGKALLRKEEGEIHVTNKDGDPYDKWDLVKKAKKIGLALHESIPFCKDKYPGYGNKRAHGNYSDAPFRLGDCTTFKFRLAQEGSC